MNAWLLALWLAAPPAELTLGWLRAEVRRVNPELASARLEAEASVERVAQAGAWEDPMLELALYNVVPAPGGGAAPIVPVMYGLSQTFPSPGTPGLRRKAAEHAVDAQRAEVAAQAAALDLRLAELHASFWLAETSHEIALANVALGKQVLALSDASVKAGRASFQDLLRAQAELAALENEVLDRARDRDLARAALNAALRREAGAPLPPAKLDEPRPIPRALLARALERRSELARARAEARVAEAARAVALRERWPTVRVYAAHMPAINGPQMFTAGVSIPLPVFAGQKQNRAAAESWLRADAALARVEAQEVAVAQEVYAAERRLETSAAHVSLHESRLLPLSDQVLAAARSQYEAGRGDLNAVLDAVRMRRMHHQDAANYRAEYHREWARLSYAVGGNLEAE